MFSKVTLHGVHLWWDEDAFFRSGKSPLAPADHVNEATKKLNLETCFVSDSYAHVHRELGGIYRYGRKIGEVEDLKDGWL